MRISDWSSDVCSSDLAGDPAPRRPPAAGGLAGLADQASRAEEQAGAPRAAGLRPHRLALRQPQPGAEPRTRVDHAVASHRPAGGPGVAAGLRPSHRHRPKHLATVTAAARAKRTAPGTEIAAAAVPRSENGTRLKKAASREPNRKSTRLNSSH